MAGVAAVSALVLAAAAPAIVPRRADSATEPGRRAYLVVNSSEEPLRCMVRVGEGEWSAPFTLEPAQQVVPEADRAGANAELLCDPPVARIRYNLRPGGRYALLRDPGEGGEVQLYGVPDGE